MNEIAPLTIEAANADLRSQVDQLKSDLEGIKVYVDWLEQENANLVDGERSLNQENAHLRVVAQQVGCPYGHRNEEGACSLGYPGCACMDDMLAVMTWEPADEDKAAVRLGYRLAEVEAQRDRLEGGIRIIRATAAAGKADAAWLIDYCVELLAALEESDDTR